MNKKYEFLIGFRSENVRFWRCWTHRNALYISISVVFADYDKIENFMKIYAQMDPKSHPQIAVWAIKGPTFEVFGRVLRIATFWWFLRCAKIDKKWQKFDTWADFGRVVPKNGEGRRQRRSSWEELFARLYYFWDKFWQNYFARLAPPSKDGVGGFKG